MSVRKHPTKEGYFIIDFYPNGRGGKRERIPIKGTEVEARLIEIDLRRETKSTTVRLFPKIAECVPDFLNYYKVDHLPAGVQRTIYSLKRLLPFFGSYQFTSITDTLVGMYKTERLKSVTHSTINKELAALSSLCKWAAMRERRYCEPITIKRYKNKFVKAPLPSVLSREEVEGLLAEMPVNKRGVVAAMYFGGLRSSEARNLSRDDVWSDRGVMIIRGKGNKQRMVPILPELQPYLEEGNKTGFIWTNPQTGEPWKDLRDSIGSAGERAGIKQRVTPHLLRHCFGTHSTESGVGLRTLQEVMGHSSSQTTEMYTTIAADHLSNDMSKFSDYCSHKEEGHKSTQKQ